MMLGLAESLANELSVGDMHQRAGQKAREPLGIHNTDHYSIALRYANRHARIRVLLDIHGSLLSLRVKSVTASFKDMIDADIKILENLSQKTEGLESSQLLAISKLGTLGRIGLSVKEVLFQQQQSAGSTMLAGDHVIWQQHFSVMLQGWYDDFSQAPRKNLVLVSATRKKISAKPVFPVPYPIRDLLEIEYQALRLQILSFPVQAVSTRLLELTHGHFGNVSSGHDALAIYRLITQDPKYSENAKMIQDALQRARGLLTTCIHLHEFQHLLYSPMRVFTRIIFAATLLLKVR
jgi:hypothetical protein